MKTLTLSIITLLLIFIITASINLPVAQGSSGYAFFMRSDSPAKIYWKFTFSSMDNNTYGLVQPEIFTSLGSTHPPNLTLDVEPKSPTGNNHHLNVTYTITAKGNTKDVYKFSWYGCGVSPLVVGLNESEVSPAVFNQFFTAFSFCYAMSGSAPDRNIVGFSDMTSKIISINSNNTAILAYGGHNGEPLPSPLKQLRSGFAARDVICKSGLQLVIRIVNDSPACVLPEHAKKLDERGGWFLQPTYVPWNIR